MVNIETLLRERPKRFRKRMSEDSESHPEHSCFPLIGERAPEFYASTTNGKIHFPNDFAGHWVVLFSHPSDFTPVCTTEFIEFQKSIADFEKLNTKLVGLSVGSLSSHLAWFDAIERMPEEQRLKFLHGEF